MHPGNAAGSAGPPDGRTESRGASDSHWRCRAPTTEAKEGGEQEASTAERNGRAASADASGAAMASAPLMDPEAVLPTTALHQLTSIRFPE
jgi:hypothetical protein